ncbi:MAG: hypothetical protein ACTHOH_13555, partial [Lysobacteraceae bacterium]
PAASRAGKPHGGCFPAFFVTDHGPQVQAAIAKARSLIAGFGSRTVTGPTGGHGLSAPATSG